MSTPGVATFALKITEVKFTETNEDLGNAPVILTQCLGLKDKVPLKP